LGEVATVKKKKRKGVAFAEVCPNPRPPDGGYGAVLKRKRNEGHDDLCVNFGYSKAIKGGYLIRLLFCEGGKTKRTWSTIKRGTEI